MHQIQHNDQLVTKQRSSPLSIERQIEACREFLGPEEPKAKVVARRFGIKERTLFKYLKRHRTAIVAQMRGAQSLHDEPQLTDPSARNEHSQQSA